MVNIKRSEISSTYVKVCTTVLNGIKDYFSEKLNRELSNSEVIDILKEIYCSDEAVTEDSVKKDHYKNYPNGQIFIS